MNYFKVICVLFVFCSICLHVFSDQPSVHKNTSKVQQSNEQGQTIYKSSETTIKTLRNMKIPEKLRLSDNMLGNNKAQITLIIYSSYTCTHCKTFFNKNFPEFRRLYVDTGKVKVIFRQYIGDPGAFEAALLEVGLDKRYGQGNWKLANKLKTYIFSHQEEWFKSRAPSEFLRKIVSQYPELKTRKIRAYIDSCLNESSKSCMDIGAGLMLNQQDAINWGVNAVPAFVVFHNGKRITTHNGSMSAKMLWILCNQKADDHKVNSSNHVLNAQQKS